jgi:phosphohistidine phosphatase SixA
MALALRRRAFTLGFMLAIVVGLAPAHASSDDAWLALRNGGILLLRHAHAPGTGDPAGFQIDDCASQRVLDTAGRRQAQAFGEKVRRERVTVGTVLSSQWCRCLETGELAFPGMPKPEPAFNSFFDEPGREAKQTAQARAIIAAWRGPGALVIVTHQVNITALSGLVPVSGEGIVLRQRTGGFEVAGRINP